ncbi:hypothetical protein PG990_005059 [Apiospora arundinis]
MPRPQRRSIAIGGVVSRLGFALMHAVTLPYYRFFRQNTLLPVQAIAKAINVRRDEDEIRAMLARWRARKLYELHFIQIAPADISMIIRLEEERGKPADQQRHRNSPPPPPQALVRWNMIFTWQAPMMLLAYSVVAFLVGLTVYVCTPLYADDDSLGGRAAAYFYLSWFGVAAAVFVWCSFWAYKFVDLDHV